MNQVLARRLALEENQSLIREMLKLAEEYCALVDSMRNIETSVFLRTIAGKLSCLYSVAIQLPYIAPETDQISESVMSNEARGALWKEMRGKLAGVENYYAVFEPLERSEVLQGSIANDLAEIYDDLRDDIALARSGAHLSDIAWSWREDFYQHWGNHAVDALKAIYWRIRCDG